MARPPGLTDAELEVVAGLVGARTSSLTSEVVWDRPHVVRVVVDDGRSFITKRPRRDDDGQTTELTRRSFARELAVLSFLGTLGGEGPAPAFVGAEGEVLVMEDLPPGPSLAEHLLGDDEGAARAAVVAYAGGLGRFHAQTAVAGSEVRFDELCGADGPTQPWWADVVDAGVDAFAAVARGLDPGVDAVGCASEARTIAAELRAPGWWRTLVHGDPCPDNMRFEATTGRFRLFDFERTSFGSCLLDASYVVAPFPTCWCFGHVPDELAIDAVAAYRSAFGAARAEVLDDGEWDAALATALGSWVVGRGQVIAKQLAEDRTWGTTTMRPRLRRWLDVFVATAERSDRFPALRAAGTAVAAAWPDAPVGDYPAMPTGSGGGVVTVPDWWRPGL